MYLLIINNDGSEEVKYFNTPYQYREARTALGQMEALGFIDSFHNTDATMYHNVNQ